MCTLLISNHFSPPSKIPNYLTQSLCAIDNSNALSHYEGKLKIEQCITHQLQRNQILIVYQISPPEQYYMTCVESVVKKCLSTSLEQTYQIPERKWHC